MDAETASKICLACPEHCCLPFLLFSDYFGRDPGNRLLKRYSFLKVVKEEKLPGINDPDQTVWVRRIRCTRYDVISNRCSNYSIEPRPPFCLSAGISYDPTGERKCRLHTALHPQERNNVHAIKRESRVLKSLKSLIR